MYQLIHTLLPFSFWTLELNVLLGQYSLKGGLTSIHFVHICCLESSAEITSPLPSYAPWNLYCGLGEPA